MLLDMAPVHSDGRWQVYASLVVLVVNLLTLGVLYIVMSCAVSSICSSLFMLFHFRLLLR